ncbi:hypothetical protein pb186bvf_021147 [Paramecium bursaria]
MIDQQNQKIILLKEQVKSKREIYLSYIIELIKQQEQIIDKNIQIKEENQSVSFIESREANQQNHENNYIIGQQDERNNFFGTKFQNKRSANDIQKQKNRFKHKYMLKRILNNSDNFSQKFIEVIHQVDFNTEQIVTVETVDTSNLKLNKQFEILKNVTIKKYQQLLLIKLDIDKDLLQRDCNWIVSIQEVKNINQIKKDDGYNRRFIYKLLRAIKCKYCIKEFYNCKAFKKHKEKLHFLDRLRIM